MSETFWAIFAAVLCANLLSIAFVWGLYSYSRLEQANQAHEAGIPLYAGIFMPLAFAFLAVYIAFGGT